MGSQEYRTKEESIEQKKKDELNLRKNINKRIEILLPKIEFLENMSTIGVGDDNQNVPISIKIIENRSLNILPMQ